MLKKLIFSGVIWCPRRLSDVQFHSIVPTAGIQGECFQQSSELFSQDGQTGSYLAQIGAGIIDDDDDDVDDDDDGTRHTMAMEYLIKKPIQVPDEDDETLTKKKDNRKSKVRKVPMKGDRTAFAAAISSPEAVESGGGDLRGIHPSSSWQRPLLVHMPAVWRSLGKAAGTVFKFNSSGDNHSSPGEFSLLPATTKESTRPEDPKGDCAADEPRKGAKRVTWQDLWEGGPGKNDWIVADASCQDADARSSRSSSPRSRNRCASRQRIGWSRDGDRAQSSPGRHIDSRRDCADQQGSPERAGGNRFGLRIRAGDSHGEGTHLGSVNVEDPTCFRVFQAMRTKSHDTKFSTTMKAELKHSAQFLERGLASKVASVAKMAAILLLSFPSNCEVT